MHPSRVDLPPLPDHCEVCGGAIGAKPHLAFSHGQRRVHKSCSHLIARHCYLCRQPCGIHLLVVPGTHGRQVVHPACRPRGDYVVDEDEHCELCHRRLGEQEWVAVYGTHGTQAVHVACREMELAAERQL